jgi:DMSO/TMAO reductase YedYZ molybdopterin-dependent catalytic subunit
MPFTAAITVLSDIAPEQWRLTVDGMADKPLTVTYDELTAGFTGLNR